MNVSYKWLKEYVNITVSPQELADRLTSSGVAVEGVKYLGEGITNTVVAYVEECGKHPDADKLSLCRVYDGETHFQVVCGASNVAQGQKIVLARIGATLPGDFIIKAAKLRGVDSQGMICSAKELGMPAELLLPEQKEGILVLPPDAPVGMDAASYLDLDDYILELDLTPDRGDCLSILNVARQVAAIFDIQIREPEMILQNPVDQETRGITISIESPEDCPRYVGKIVEKIKVGPSPFWMQNRLRSAGIRPISNVVDVTNFVLLEMGQPLHAFDYERLAGEKIIVRRARQGETIVTLDDQERSLDSDMLLICDGEKPVAIAGVMGGANSEVTTETRNVLIESAYFSPVSIRKTATRLGLRSEASARFEKGINYEQCALAALRAAQLLEQIAGGKPYSGEVDVYPAPIPRARVRLHYPKANSVLGTSLTNQEIDTLLSRLQLLKVEEEGEAAVYEIPAFRPDLRIEEDLIEEVASLFGLENIPVTLPYGATNPGARNTEQKMRLKIQETLAGLGMNEIITYSFINRSHLEKIQIPPQDLRRNVVEVLNPLSEEQGIMRTSLLPGMLETVLRNHNRRNEDMLLFEMGKVYLRDGFPDRAELPLEEQKLCLFGRGIIARDWQNKGKEVDYYYLKGILAGLFSALKVEGISFQPANDAGEYHPGRCAKILLDGSFLGYVGELHPQVADHYDLGGRNYIAELDLRTLLAVCREKTDYRYLPKFPGMSRDLALLAGEEIPASRLIEIIEQAGGELLRQVEVFDLYQGSQIPQGKKSIAFTLRFQAEDRTLTDEEVSVCIKEIKEALERETGARLRE